jgi:hypothetical protein
MEIYHGLPNPSPAEHQAIFDLAECFTLIASDDRFTPQTRRAADAIRGALKSFFLATDATAPRGQRLRLMRSVAVKLPRPI